MGFIDCQQTNLFLDHQAFEDCLWLPKIVEEGLGCAQNSVVLALWHLPQNSSVFLHAPQVGNLYSCCFKSFELIHDEAHSWHENDRDLSCDNSWKLEAETFSWPCWLHYEGILPINSGFDHGELPVLGGALFEMLHQKACWASLCSAVQQQSHLIWLQCTCICCFCNAHDSQTMLNKLPYY